MPNSFHHSEALGKNISSHREHTWKCCFFSSTVFAFFVFFGLVFRLQLLVAIEKYRGQKNLTEIFRKAQYCDVQLLVDEQKELIRNLLFSSTNMAAMT